MVCNSHGGSTPLLPAPPNADGSKALSKRPMIYRPLPKSFEAVFSQSSSPGLLLPCSEP
jgi:hypothetical protein